VRYRASARYFFVNSSTYKAKSDLETCRRTAGYYAILSMWAIIYFRIFLVIDRAAGSEFMESTDYARSQYIINQYVDIFFKMVCFILDGNVFLNYRTQVKTDILMKR
jgi:hypothetical protein